MKKIAVFTIIAILIFSSCDSFFSESYGSSRDYDWKNINLSTSNVHDWVLASVGNPPLAVAVMRAIMHKLETAPQADRAIYFKYAARIAIEASSLGTALLVNLTELIGSGSDDISGDKHFRDMLDKVQEDFIAGGGQEAADMLAQLLLVGVNNQGGAPRFDNQFANSVQPSQVAETLIVLLLGEMADNDNVNSSNIDNLATMGIVKQGGEMKVLDWASPRAVAIAACLNLIGDDNTGKYDDNPITGAVSDLFRLGDNQYIDDDNDDDEEDDDEEDED